MLKKGLKKIVLSISIVGIIISSFAAANAYTYSHSCAKTGTSHNWQTGTGWKLEVQYDYGSSFPYDDACINAYAKYDGSRAPNMLYTKVFLQDGVASVDDWDIGVMTQRSLWVELSGHDYATGYSIARIYNGDTDQSPVFRDMRLDVRN